MRDPVFSARDVSEAVKLASRTLSLPESALRYVVLDPGQPGGRGLKATEARIAVLLDKPGPRADPETIAATPRPAREHGERAERGQDHAGDPAQGVRDLLRQFARVSEQELSVEVEELRDTLEVRVDGPGAHLFFDPEGEVLAALEHVLERSYGRALDARRVRVRCAGYREYRDEVLRELARRLARDVLEDGQARATEPLNAYERRIVHMTLEALPGVTTYSVGEGPGRRVTVAPAESSDPQAEETRAPQTEAPEAMSDGPAADVAGVAPSADAPTDQTTEPAGASPGAFDYSRFDRPPQGGSDTHLM